VYAFVYFDGISVCTLSVFGCMCLCVSVSTAVLVCDYVCLSYTCIKKKRKPLLFTIRARILLCTHAGVGGWVDGCGEWVRCVCVRAGVGGWMWLGGFEGECGWVGGLGGHSHLCVIVLQDRQILL